MNLGSLICWESLTISPVSNGSSKCSFRPYSVLKAVGIVMLI